ncbi:DUF5615 family PIN-like protein [Endozoicomonas gorgoniicola]|uniref:DUF5615 family PIN-like protein n=1 Tax=Endozoicomonas gorgoniicola TaxID=1234144 RepID=A0ABT3MV53_9GAMM|nr:DUF5615 family PIN-like protein [Endozoicomonas gorgoniicola]MCW7553238.1 DUF5615 family PIN-like protein [Endozoicomonas gorgoniicola]
MLLLDENLSPRLVARLEEVFPGILHVLHAGLDNSPDIEIWHYAKENQLTIVSKDKDFIEFSQQHGFPPKLIRVSVGNVRIAQLEKLLLNQRAKILEFIKYSDSGYLTISSTEKFIT